MGSTRNGIEFCFNSQTVLILLLLLKQFVGLNCCHLTKVVVHLYPINSLVNGRAHEPMVTLWDVSKTSHSAFSGCMTEFRQPLQVQSHLEMPGILVQLGHIQRT